MPKVVSGKKGRKTCALEKQLAFDSLSHYEKKARSNKTNGVAADETEEGDEPEDEVMNESLTRKTLELAREQQDEEKEQNAERLRCLGTPYERPSPRRRVDASEARPTNTPLDDENSDDESNSEDEMFVAQENDMVRVNDGYVEEIEISEMDEATLASFMMDGGERRSLADIIMQKIHEKEAIERGEIQPQQKGGCEFDPKIIQVYNGVGKILKRYTSGKLPKAFKVIPSLSYWEDILWLTHPEEWSPHAMRAATRLFASNLNPKMAQRFYNIFLLEHVRQDIHENKRLNFHLYMALKKALYKPQAFFKGIVLPLCEGRNCTILEATIIASVLVKVSVPVIHSAAALMKLAEMPYSGASCLFIRIILSKKYSLPSRVINQLSNYFINFTNDTQKLPVIWHQAYLEFAQRFKNSISVSDKEKMKALLKQHFHYQISPEIRRELYNQQAIAAMDTTQ